MTAGASHPRGRYAGIRNRTYCRRTRRLRIVRGTWTKAGVTEQEQKRDTLDCLDQARTMVAGPQGPRPTVDQDSYRDCMASRGYTMGAGTK
jgi:hypothetical protein